MPGTICIAVRGFILGTRIHLPRIGIYLEVVTTDGVGRQDDVTGGGDDEVEVLEMQLYDWVSDLHVFGWAHPVILHPTGYHLDQQSSGLWIPESVEQVSDLVTPEAAYSVTETRGSTLTTQFGAGSTLGDPIHGPGTGIRIVISQMPLYVVR